MVTSYINQNSSALERASERAIRDAKKAQGAGWRDIGPVPEMRRREALRNQSV